MININDKIAISVSGTRVDAEFVLRILSVEIDWICGYYFLRVEKKEIANDLVASVSSFVDTTGSLDSCQIFTR